MPSVFVWHLPSVSASCHFLSLSSWLCLLFLAPSASFVSIVLQLISSMSSVMISSIPSKACQFPGTTKKLHILTLLLFSTFTLHLLNCVIVVCFRYDVFIFVAASCFYVALGNNFCKCVKALCFDHCLCLLYVLMLL